MREYGILSPRFWIGKTGRALRKYPDAQRVALYLISAPTSEMTGVFYCPLSLIASDVGFFEAPSKPHRSPLDGVKDALLVLQEVGFCQYDFTEEWVFVKEMARWQIGEKLKPSDKRVIGLKKFISAMPDSLRYCFLSRYNDCYSLGYTVDELVDLKPIDKGIASPIEAPSKPHRSQEQEQEQEQFISSSVTDVTSEDSTPRAKMPSGGNKARTYKLDIKTLPDDWRAYCEQTRPDLDPDVVFTAFRSCFTSGSKAGTMRSEKGWNQSWFNWVRNEREPRNTYQTSRQPARKSEKEPNWAELDYGTIGAI